MSIDDVTRQGLRHTRPGREATVTGPKGGPGADDSLRSLGADGGRPDGAPGPRVGRDRTDEEPGSYYGLPVLNQPVWSAPDIPGYFFLGGLAGASSVLGAGAALSGRPALRRSTDVVAAGAISLSLVALVHDLGRPGRFLNMLRVLKVTSPMSVGAWLLAAYSPLAGGAAFTALTGRLRRVGGLASAGAAVLGPAVAAYTVALVADTAVPAWHDGHREMPLLFAASGAAAAGGAAMALTPVAEAGPARRLGALGSLVEVATATAMERRMGPTGEPYHSGRAGTLMRSAKVAGVLGAVGAVTFGRRSRSASVLSGAALVAASALTRFGVFDAGLQSAADPRSTVQPQRERLERTTPGRNGST